MTKTKLNIFNDEFKDFIESLNKSDVEYILIGGYAVVLHGYYRTTGDLDIWVSPTESNFKKLLESFSIFGLPTTAIDIEKFLKKENYNVFTFGRPPLAIDIVTSIQGVNFYEAYQNIIQMEVQGVEVNLLSISDLIKTKKATGRFKDLDDLQNLDMKE